MLQIRDASVAFPASDGSAVHALDHVSLDIAPDSIVVAVGASGCGKSTLLNAIAGFLPLTAGSITLDGEEIDRPGGDRGVVFQKDTLLPWASVVDNVALGLKFAGLSKTARRERARELLDLVGLADFADKPPYELSGGMRQRVGLARALATDPKILLMDEPFGALDAFTREELWGVMQALWLEKRFTGVLVTHDLREAVYLADTVYVMSRRPGRIVMVRKIDLPRPRTLAATFEPAFVDIVHELRDRIHQEHAA